MGAGEESIKVPITVITGFLAAGKTTMVNHILQGEQQQHFCRLPTVHVGTLLGRTPIARMMLAW